MFFRLMIPHHQAAVPMAEAAIKQTDQPEVENLAGAVVATQKGEIQLMKIMLLERGAEAPSGSQDHEEMRSH